MLPKLFGSSIIHKLFLYTVLFALTVSPAHAGTTGKITGKVVDKETGEPVVDANIVEVEQGMFGGSTDLDGEFVIINIPPGVYNVEFSSLNYHSVVIQDVIINSDLTTNLEIELTSSSHLLPDAIIKYKKPAVQRDVSSSVKILDKKRITVLHLENIGDLLEISKGFKTDDEGFFHVRGSRAGDVAFYVDGVDMRDPLVNTQSRLNISGQSVDEVQVLTGATPAEFGGAMGAVVQIRTPEGSTEKYAGRFEYQSDRMVPSYSFDTDRSEVSFGGPVPYSRDLLGETMTFFFSGVGRMTNTYTPFAINRQANDYSGIGINLPERQDNNYQGSLKLAFPLSGKKKLTFDVKGGYSRWDIYPRGEGSIQGNYGYGYKYNLENRPWAENRQFSSILTYTNSISSKTFYEMKLIVFRTHSLVRPGVKEPGDFTLRGDIEDEMTFAFDRNLNGWLDPDEITDSDGDGFMDGFIDANRNSVFDGGGEGYEDLNFNGMWDRGEDWVDLNGNGTFDAAEPWIDVVNPLTGENNLGSYDSWDSFSDLNGNGRWDPAEPQLPEHDWNQNGRWDGERFVDANNNGRYDAWEPWSDLNGNFLWDPGEPFTDTNHNGRFDYSEGYDDSNANGRIDRRDLVPNTDNSDSDEPFVDGDYWWNTGEPFIDEPDPVTGKYNGRWDDGEIWFDLPSSSGGTFGAGYYFIGDEMTLNGRYDGPNYAIDGGPLFDEYELFTSPAISSPGSNPARPVEYSFDSNARGTDWPTEIFEYIPGKSTWINRTLHDKQMPVFNLRNTQIDPGMEQFIDYNGNGVWDRIDYFLNDGEWDPTAYWQDRVSTEYTVKFNIQSQVSKFHEIKTGAEIKYRDLVMQTIQQPDLVYAGEAALPEGSPWPDRGGIRDFYDYQPIEGAAFIQDKMEFEGLIVNAGLRYDFILHDQDVIDEFRERLLAGEPGAILAQRGTWRLSPRLGISHPITDRSKLYFNYGHFYQAPQFQYFYRSATANFEANSTIGNPNLEYEKTIQYELGVNTQITDYVVIDIAGYYKDQYDLISTADERWKNMTLDRYVNLDYGRMRGFEFSVDKLPANHYALDFSYDFSYAFGKASDQHANRDARLNNVPYNYDEHPLNWDETHKVNANLTINYARGEHLRFGNLILPDDWMLTLQWQFGSGLPYTPGKYLVGIDNSNLILPNSERYPWHERTTLKFEKFYTVESWDNNRLSFGFTVNNLFNKRNVNALFRATGTPTESKHPADPTYNPRENRAEYDSNPRNWSAGRNVLFRVGMSF